MPSNYALDSDQDPAAFRVYVSLQLPSLELNQANNGKWLKWQACFPTYILAWLI